MTAAKLQAFALRLASVVTTMAVMSASAFAEDVVADRPGDLATFPIVETTARASDTDVFAWVVRQGAASKLYVASAPDFSPRLVAERTDDDGLPISAVALSPDGTRVVFQTGYAVDTNRAANPAGLAKRPAPTLWLTDKDGAERRLGAGSSAQFTARGAIFYRASGALWLKGTPDAEPRELLNGIGSVDDIAWSPDGGAIAFTRSFGPANYVGVYRLDEAQVRWMSPGVDRDIDPTWSPDGRRIAFLRARGREHGRVYRYQSEPFSLVIADVASGATRTVWSQGLLLREYAEQGFGWRADGTITVLSDHDGWQRLYGIDPVRGSAVALSPEHCEVDSALWDKAGVRMTASHNCDDIDRRQIALIGADRAFHTVSPPSKVAARPLISASGRFAFWLEGDARQPLLPRVVETESAQARLTETNDTYGIASTARTLVEPKAITFPAPDGTIVHAQLFLPPGGARGPALVFVHGGPQRQMFPGFHTSNYYAQCYLLNQRLAVAGFAVLSVNFRSGSGYGRAFRENPNRGPFGMAEYQDVAAAGRWLARQPGVDPRRVGIWGGSYGGMLTAQALGRNSDIFAAGVALHGVFDWTFAVPGRGVQDVPKLYGVDVTKESSRRLAERNSPVSRLATWRSPVLLITGDDDGSVDAWETVSLAQKLRDRRVDVEAIVLPGERHAFVRYQSWRIVGDAVEKFFSRTLTQDRK